MKNTLTRYSLFIFLLFLGSSERIFAQQGFGTKEPSKASVVDMQAENRGLLVPRVALTSLTSFLPVTGETSTEIAKTNSLLVYNTADVNEDIFPGFYYWTTDGSDGKWNRLVTLQDVSGTTANNGLTKTVDNIIQLGGDLEGNTEINLDGHTLAIEGLLTGSSTDNAMVADPTTGVLRQVKQAPRFFYMPPVIFDTSNPGTNLTRDIYQDYVNQFTGVNPYNMAHGADGSGNGQYSMPYNKGLVRSPSAPVTIPVYGRTDLYYYIPNYDTTVFNNVSISDNGILTYDIIGTATDISSMTIVFQIKD